MLQETLMSYLIATFIWYIIFTEKFEIRDKKTEKPVSQTTLFLFCLFWIITIPISIYSTMKHRKENDDDL